MFRAPGGASRALIFFRGRPGGAALVPLTWRRFDDLPPAARRRVDRASGPKLLSILRTRWPDAELLVEEDAGFVPAGDARDPLPASSSSLAATLAGPVASGSTGCGTAGGASPAATVGAGPGVGTSGAASKGEAVAGVAACAGSVASCQA